MPSRRVTDFLLFAAVFTMSFEKIFWNVAGKIALTEVLSILFVGAYALRRLGRRDGSLPRTSGIVLAFFAAFLLVYLVGFYNLETTQGLTQFGKGMGKFVLHFAFLVAAVDYLFRSSERVYWRMLAWFCLGVAANAAYGVIQLAAAQAGRNLDATLIEPITGHSTQINIYGAVGGSNVYRIAGLTPDPNHLGIQLVVPLLVLGPLYLRLERKHRLRVPLALLIAGLLAVELATLSRSGLLGLGAGFLVLLGVLSAAGGTFDEIRRAVEGRIRPITVFLVLRRLEWRGLLTVESGARYRLTEDGERALARARAEGKTLAEVQEDSLESEEASS